LQVVKSVLAHLARVCGTEYRVQRAIMNAPMTATNRPTNDGLELVDSAIDSRTTDNGRRRDGGGGAVPASEGRCSPRSIMRRQRRVLWRQSRRHSVHVNTSPTDTRYILSTSARTNVTTLPA